MRGFLTLAALVTCLGSPSVVLAAPFSGEGQAPASSGKGAPHGKALERARRAALERALEAVAGPVDPARREQVLAELARWTGSYRVLEQRSDGATITVRVEVDVDLPRLGKRLAPEDARAGRGRPILGRLDVGDGCPDADVRRWLSVEIELASASAPGPRLDMTVSCRVLGTVPFTHLTAAEVSARVLVDGKHLPEAREPGFGPGADAALAAAVGRVLGNVLPGIVALASEGLALRVEPGAPAASIRRLRKGIESSVRGVSGARLAGIDRDGGVRIAVSTALDGAALADRIRALSLPGISVTIIRHDARTLSIALH